MINGVMHLKRNTPALEYFNTPLTSTSLSREYADSRKFAVPVCPCPFVFQLFSLALDLLPDPGRCRDSYQWKNIFGDRFWAMIAPPRSATRRIATLETRDETGE
jgi:hypothetical protein